jgi:hypothetical protein
MKKYLPLICVEGYLIATLLVFYFGPVAFKVHSQPIFAALLILYHASFIFGYFVSIKTYRKIEVKVSKPFSHRLYHISFFFGLVGVLGAYKNLMLTSSFIPYDFFDNLIIGLSEPGLVYSERMMSAETGVTSDSRLFNIASIFFSFFKLLYIFQFVYFWEQLGRLKKVLAVAYSLLFISSGIASGTNSVIFIFFIFLTFSLLVTLYVRDYVHLRRVLIICGALFLLPIAFFGYIMSHRGGGFEYFSGTSPLGDISISVKPPALEDGSLVDFFYYSFVWLDYYVVQGYYGFSLILDLDHNWTFGFGNSAFLQRQLLMLTDIDISKLTFQHRISQYWDESAQWHSFYGQFANDFGLVGLTLFMFFLGYYLSNVWASIIYKNSFYGVALMPIFMLMFIFFPANNQVFSYIDTLSYFIVVSFFWILEDKKMRFRRHV